MGFWLSVAGLGLLLWIWLANLVDVIRGPFEARFTIGPDDPPDPLPTPAPSLSIIVPARNEEAHIGRCVRAALAADWPGPLEVVVVDDRSTDRTGEILSEIAAADPRLKVVEGRDPGEGWLGKPHALHIAQAEASGDWLLFVDADVTLSADGPRKLIARTIKDQATMASVLGSLEVQTFWERVIQTRIAAVIAAGNPMDEVNDPERPDRALANGQCLLFSRETYDSMDGHMAVQSSVLDDVDFAKRAKADEVAYRLYYGPRVFSCRMYTSLSEIWSGWTKNLFPALHYSVIVTFIVTALLFAASVLPFVLLTKNLAVVATGGDANLLFIGAEAVICAVILATDAVGHARQGYRWGLFWTFPLGMTLILTLFWYSAWRIKSGRGAVWKGRVVESGKVG